MFISGGGGGRSRPLCNPNPVSNVDALKSSMEIGSNSAREARSQLAPAKSRAVLKLLSNRAASAASGWLTPIDASCNEPMVTRSAGSDVNSGSMAELESDEDACFSCAELERPVRSLVLEIPDPDTDDKIEARRRAALRASMSRVGDGGVWRVDGRAATNGIWGVSTPGFRGESVAPETPVAEDPAEACC